MQYHILPTLEYPKSASVSLEQPRLNQATQEVMGKRFMRRIYKYRSSIQLSTNNIESCLGIVVILYARRQYRQFNTLTIALLYYKSIIYQ